MSNYIQHDKNMKNRRRPIPLDINIMLGPYKQAAVDHHGYSLECGHDDTSVHCCVTMFFSNDDRITEYDVSYTCNSSTA